MADRLGAAARAARRARKQSTACIKSAMALTDNPHGFTERELLDMAESIARATPFSALKLSFVAGLLLTFTAVDRGSFERTLRTACDLRQACDLRLENTIVMLGWAMTARPPVHP